MTSLAHEYQKANPGEKDALLFEVQL